MRRILLILTLAMTIASCSDPNSGIKLIVPVHALERLEFNEGDLFFMLSVDSSCKHEFSNHNYTVMFGNHEGDWGDVRVWSQHVTLYMTKQEARKIEDEVYLCIRFKGQWEAAWKGSYDLPSAYKSFFCNKENNSSKWECSGYETYHDEKEEIHKLLKKYNEPATSNKAFSVGYFSPLRYEKSR